MARATKTFDQSGNPPPSGLQTEIYVIQSMQRSLMDRPIGIGHAFLFFIRTNEIVMRSYLMIFTNRHRAPGILYYFASPRTLKLMNYDCDVLAHEEKIMSKITVIT